MHSILSPSSGNKWGAEHGCTGYPSMFMLYGHTQPDTTEAMEGTASHEIGCDCIDKMRRGGVPSFKDYDGRTATNGVLFTRDMYDAAMMYANDVISVARKNNIFGGPNFGLESRIDITPIHDQCYGFADSWIYADDSNHLYVWDYKYGMRWVDVFECIQLLLYLCGVAHKYNLNDQLITVHLRIVQPRCYHSDGPIQEWIFNLADVRAIFNRLETKAHEALSDKAILRSGPHCRDCCALHACPAAIRGGMSLYETATQVNPVNLPPDQMAIQFTHIQRARRHLEQLEDSIGTQLMSTIENGVIVPGYTIESGRGRDMWNMNPLHIATFGDTIKHDLRKPVDVITVKQARDRGVSDDQLKAFVKRKSGSAKLTATNPTQLRRLFT